MQLAALGRPCAFASVGRLRGRRPWGWPERVLSFGRPHHTASGCVELLGLILIFLLGSATIGIVLARLMNA